MNTTTSTASARACRAPLFAPMAAAVILLCHQAAAATNWFDSVNFFPPDGSSGCRGRAMGFVRSDGQNSIVTGASIPDGQGYYTFPIVEFRQRPNSNAWQFTNLSASAGGPDGSSPMAYVRSDGLSTVVYAAYDDQHLHELAMFNGSWGHTDVSAAAVPPGLPTSTDQFWGYVRGDKVSAIVYVADADRHIHELARVSSQWHDADLSAVAGDLGGAGTNEDGGLQGYVQADGTSAVVYVGQDGKIRELELYGGKWHVNTIGLQGGQPVAGGVPMGYVRADGVNAVVYLGHDGHIHELSQVSSRVKGFGWVDTDLNLAGGGLVFSTGWPWPIVREDHVSAVMYTDTFATPAHVHQLALVNGHWKDTDLSAVAGSPYGSNYLITAFVDNHKQTVVPRCIGDDNAFRGDLAVMRDGLLPP